MTRLRIFLLALLPLLTASLHADLVWDRETGWRVEGGLIEPFIGDALNAGNALDLMNAARAAQEDQSYFRAIYMYETVYEDYPQSIYAPEALFQSAQIHVARHQFEDANEELNAIVKRYPEYSKFNQVVGLQFEIASRLMEGDRPYYWGVVPGFRNYDAAIDFYENILENAPYSKYAPVALMNIALIAKSQGNTEEAIDALDRLITNYPQSMLAPDAYLNLAQTFAALVDGAYYDQGATREAISYFEDFLILYPDDPNVGQAENGLRMMRDTLSKSKLLIGEFYYYKRNKPDAAMVFLNDAITAAPESDSAERAQQIIQKIEDGVPPPVAPMQWLFDMTGDDGYSSSSEEQVEDETSEASSDDDGLDIAPLRWLSGAGDYVRDQVWSDDSE